MVRQLTVTTFVALMLSGVIMMTGCSTAMDGATEDIRIKIAGTGEALCDVTQPGRRFRVYAPSTFRAPRSRDDLRIRCLAPGNREQTVILKSELSDKLAYNVSNLGLGVAWDGMTGAMYNYPKEVLIDFTAIPPTSYPQPDYQDVFDRNPELMQMEQFRPGSPALGSDIGSPSPTLQPRTVDEDNSMGIMMAPPTSPGATSSSANTPKAPLPPILPPVAAPVATTTTTSTTTVTPGLSSNMNQNGTSNSTLAPGSTSKSTSQSSTSMKIFTGKIGNASNTNQ